MDAFKSLVDHLASPPWLFVAALVPFLVARASQGVWSRRGGVALAVLAAGLSGLAMTDDGFRRLIFHPERLPAAVLLAASGVLLWLELHRARSGRAPRPGAGGVTAADAVAATLAGLALVACALLFQAPLGAAADPSSRPDLVKAPWFLAGLQELDHYFDPWVPYAAVPLLLIGGLLGLSWFEDAHGRRLRALFLFGWLFLWLWPLAVGALLRGPGWHAFGPFEPWDATRPPPGEPAALSEIFWIGWLGTLEPARWWLRELPGMLLLAGYFVLLPLGLLRWRATRAVFTGLRESLGRWRFHAAAAWVQALLLLPLKMLGRWWLEIGYWITLPELGLNL